MVYEVTFTLDYSEMERRIGRDKKGEVTISHELARSFNHSCKVITTAHFVQLLCRLTGEIRRLLPTKFYG